MGDPVNAPGLLIARNGPVNKRQYCSKEKCFGEETELIVCRRHAYSEQAEVNTGRTTEGEVWTHMHSTTHMPLLQYAVSSNISSPPTAAQARPPSYHLFFYSAFYCSVIKNDLIEFQFQIWPIYDPVWSELLYFYKHRYFRYFGSWLAYVSYMFAFLYANASFM